MGNEDYHHIVRSGFEIHTGRIFNRWYVFATRDDYTSRGHWTWESLYQELLCMGLLLIAPTD